MKLKVCSKFGSGRNICNVFNSQQVVHAGTLYKQEIENLSIVYTNARSGVYGLQVERACL